MVGDLNLKMRLFHFGYLLNSHFEVKTDGLFGFSSNTEALTSENPLSKDNCD
jgi:hypothetical protein